MPMNPRLLRPRQNIGWSTLSSGLHAYYTFDTWLDYSGNDRDLEYGLVETTPGKFGLAAKPSAYDSYASRGDQTISAWGKEITLCGWVKCAGQTLDDARLFTSENGTVVLARSFSDLYGYAGGSALSISSVAIDDGAWHFFCLRRNAEFSKFRVDTAEVTGAGSGTDLNQELRAYTFFYDPTNDAYADTASALDAVGLWSRSLTDAEVNWLYNEGLGREYPMPEFTPQTLGGVTLWLDATTGVTLDPASGKVSAWADQSGAGRNFTQSTDSQRPSYASTLNGRQVLSFAFSSSQQLTRTGVTNADYATTSGASWWILHRPTSGANTYTLLNNGSDPDGIDNFQNTQAYPGQFRDVRNAFNPGIGLASNGGTQLYGQVVSTSVHSYRLQFTQRQSTDSRFTQWRAGTNKTWSIGFLGANVNGDIAETLIYNRTLYSNEVDIVEGYLAWKWGLQDQLPATHPYASQFPGLGTYGAADHVEALNWASRVTTNGGTYNYRTLAAVSNFCKAIDAAGLRGKFVRLNLLCGNNRLAAGTPLYRASTAGGTALGRTADTLNGFVDANYTPANGLAGGSGRYIMPGLTPATVAAATGSYHIGAVSTASGGLYTGHFGTLFSGQPRVIVEAGIIPAGYTYRAIYGALTGNSTPNVQYQPKTYYAHVVSPTSHRMLVGGNDSGPSSHGQAYVNTEVAIMGYATGVSPDTASAGFGGNFWAYSIGGALTASESGTLNNILAAFFAAIGRA